MERNDGPAKLAEAIRIPQEMVQQAAREGYAVGYAAALNDGSLKNQKDVIAVQERTAAALERIADALEEKWR